MKAALLLATVFAMLVACGGESSKPLPTATESPTITATSDSLTPGTAEPTPTVEPPTATATDEPTETPTETATEEPTGTPTEEPGDLLFDPARADELSHAAMFGVDELPSGPWEVTEEDVFSEGPLGGLSSAVPACAAIEPDLDAIDERVDSSRAGRAQRQLSADDARTDTDVAMNVSIFDDADLAGDTLELYRELVTRPEFIACFEGTIQENLPEGGTAEVTAGTPHAGAVEGGIALAFDIAFDIQGQQGTLRLEPYLWHRGNAGVSLTVQGVDENVTDELIVGAIEAAQDGLDRAESGELSPTPTVEPTETTTPTGLAFDPDRAEEIAAAAFPAVEDLGEGFTIDSTNDFDNVPFDDLNEEAAECSAISAAWSDAVERLEPQAAGRSAIQFAGPLPAEDDALPASPSVDITIFRSNEAADDAVAIYADLLGRDEWLPCLNATLDDDTIDLDVTEQTPLAEPPHDGVAFAVLIGAPSPGNEAYVEFYAWAQGNAFVLIGMFGADEVVSAELIETVINVTHERLDGLEE